MLCNLLHSECCTTDYTQNVALPTTLRMLHYQLHSECCATYCTQNVYYIQVYYIVVHSKCVLHYYIQDVKHYFLIFTLNHIRKIKLIQFYLLLNVHL